MSNHPFIKGCSWSFVLQPQLNQWGSYFYHIHHNTYHHHYTVVSFIIICDKSNPISPQKTIEAMNAYTNALQIVWSIWVMIALWVIKIRSKATTFWTFQNCSGTSRLVEMMKLTSWIDILRSTIVQEHGKNYQDFTHHSQSATLIGTMRL